MKTDWTAYRTTISGVVSGLCGFVSLHPDLFLNCLHWPPVLVQLCNYAASGGLIALGIMASDAVNKKKDGP